MVKLLLYKLLRDMRRSGVTYGICMLIVAVGFCGYSVLSICADQLRAIGDYFYQQTRFPDAFAAVQQAPANVIPSLLAIPGVEDVEGRLTRTVRLAGYQEQAPELKLISVGDKGYASPMVLQGTAPGAGREILLGTGFFAAHDYQVGDSVTLLINGREQTLTVCGSGISPENIYMIKDMVEMLPDPEAYEAAFLSLDTMSRLLAAEGMYNEFVFALTPGADFDPVKRQIEEILEPYGCYSVYLGKDQLSVSMLEAELEQVGRMATVLPFLFLIVAAVILYITLYRMVEQQRVQAGTMLALGLPRWGILLHYLGFGFTTGLVGGLIGGVLGFVSAGPMTDLYRFYFSLPEYSVPFSWSYLLQGTVLAALFCGLVGMATARRLANLPPAEAQRPAAPKSARRSWLERLPLARLFTVPGLMAVRSLARNRRRSLLALAGIAFAFMITATLVSMNSMFDVYIFDYLEKTQRQDITVYFSQPVADTEAVAAVHDAAVERVEGVLEFPVNLKGPSGEIDCGIQAIAADSALCVLYDADGNRVYPAASGIVISEHMARLLGVELGDRVLTEVSYPEKKQAEAVVTGIIAQYVGSTAYMTYAAAARISDYRGVYTSLLIKAPQTVRERLLERLEGASKVSLVESRLRLVEKYRSMMGNMSSIMAAMALMGVLIGFAVIYTSSLISFEEMKREISTMMMLGVSPRQCLDVVSVSQWILAIAAFAPGIALTYWASHAVSASLASDLYTLPDFVEGKSVLFAMLLTACAVVMASRVLLRRIKQISPVELLRERE